MSKSSHPDADLHPTATGAAATTVSAHQSPAPLKLYAGWFCPFVQRVWLVLEEKKIPYQYIEVNPYHKPESLLKLNPRGLVPTLEYDDKPLYESTVVCEFLEEAYAEYGVSLMPGDVYERARTRIWTDFVTSRVIPGFHRFLQFQPWSDEEGLKEVRDEFLGYLKEFTKEMDGEGPYFLGKEASLIDFVIAPWAVSIGSLLTRSCMLIQKGRYDYGSLITTKVVLESQKMDKTKRPGKDSTNGFQLSRNGQVLKRQRVSKNIICQSTRDMQMTKPRVNWLRRLERAEVYHKKLNVALVPISIHHHLNNITPSPTFHLPFPQNYHLLLQYPQLPL